ncbi:Protein UBASH3A -like protein [Toxocara canis]|uniref:Protein UBASH3A-like protein n=1 Tax=Toxocara canis TaxID=6265 RepID=A0A0B2UN39_TOXCA|nr:Protein UBASH3A -like protein [Toxocara canis]
MPRRFSEQKKMTVGELLENDDTDLEGISDASSHDGSSMKESLFESDSEEEVDMKAKKKSDEESNKMRIFLFRNSEPVNNISDQWMAKSFVDGKYVRYDLNQPSELLHRTSTSAFKSDPPLTVIGSRMCEVIGEAFISRDIEFDAVYCSPSLRCIQTAHKLISMQKKRVPLRIEPMLYSFCEIHRLGIPQFMSESELATNEIAIDKNYEPFFKLNDLMTLRTENCLHFQERSHQAIQHIAKAAPPRGNILVVTHACNIHAIARALKSESGDKVTTLEMHKARQFYPYCSLVCMKPCSRHSWTQVANVIPAMNCTDFTTRFNHHFLSPR